jgi:inner membrane protein involved in colicin E2 resistance
MAGYLDGYVTVAERIDEAHRLGLLEKITTESPVMLNELMGFIRATVEFTDGRKASGIASFRLDVKIKGPKMSNPLEDAETSAVGRCLAFLGISSKRGIASAEEVAIADSRNQLPPVSRMKRMSDAIRQMINACQKANIEIDHDLAAFAVGELSEDEMVTYGKYLRDLLSQEISK